MEAKYKRVLLKVSGEALAGPGKTGIDEKMLEKVADDVIKMRDMGIQVAIVVGGGNFWRGRTSEGMDRPTADYMGMLATCMNAMGLNDMFRRKGIDSRVMTAVSMPTVCEPYTINRARDLLDRNVTLVLAGGTGSPFFSTDTGAALRATELSCDVILLAKKVDAVYDSDPEKNPNAKKYKRLTHTEVLEKDLKVMDSTAASMCRDNNVSIHVFGLAEKDGIIRACKGEEIGTIVE